MGFSTMLKMNMKLLLRNKGYLIFLVLLPIISMLLLNIPQEETYYSDSTAYTVNELSNLDAHILQKDIAKLNVMVYDHSNSYLSEFIVQELAQTGTYGINRYRIVEDWIQDPADIEQVAIAAADKSNFAAIIYIPEDFEEKVRNNDEYSIHFYMVTSDERVEILVTNINLLLGNLYTFSDLAEDSPEKLEPFIERIKSNEIYKDEVVVSINNEVILTGEQELQKNNIEYSIAVLSLAFLFSGIFIAAVVIEEKDNGVLTRVLLTNTTRNIYNLCKMVLVVFTVTIQVTITAIGILLFVKQDMGISFVSYIFFIFGMGLIFNLISVVIGTIFGNVINSSYIAYFIWVISGTISGLYFPAENLSGFWRGLSYFMPQQWVIKLSELLLGGQSGVYTTFLVVVGGFLIFLFCIDFVAIKVMDGQ